MRWQKIISEAARSGVFPQLPATANVRQIVISLTEEERQVLSEKIYEAIKPQLVEFGDFVQDGLKEMPPHRLKALAEQVERGKVPVLRRRQGCVFIACGEGEFYLGL